MANLLRALLARLRDTGDLRDTLVSIAVAYFAVELLQMAAGPLSPPLASLGILVLALLLIYGVVPRLRRGRW